MENCVDRKWASNVDVYESTVSDQWVKYVKPQEMGNHEDLRWISITNFDGQGFVFVAADKLSATALHVRAQDMTDPEQLQKRIHDYEIMQRKETILCLDAATDHLEMQVVALVLCRNTNCAQNRLHSVLCATART